MGYQAAHAADGGEDAGVLAAHVRGDSAIDVQRAEKVGSELG